MGRLNFSRTQRADVAVLKRNLELWPVFRDIVAGHSVLELETIKTPLNVRDVFRIVRYVIVNKASVGYASMAAQLRRSRVKVLLAVDQTSQVVEELGRLLPELRQVVVAHGSIRDGTLHLMKTTRRHGRVLCVWGQSDVDVYQRVVESPVQCRIVGSLRNADYKRQNMRVTVNSRKYPLLLISQYAGAIEDDLSHASKRVQILGEMKRLTHRYCSERSLPLRVALRPPVSSAVSQEHRDDEIRHYQQMFDGVELSFTNPDLAYSSYLASDESDVTIGVPSGALTESFARGNKVLMFRQDPASGGYYGFPIEGQWLLTEPTYDQFAERLDVLRAMRREDCANSWRAEREYMVANAESDESIKLVRQLIDRAICGEVL